MYSSPITLPAGSTVVIAVEADGRISYADDDAIAFFGVAAAEEIGSLRRICAPAAAHNALLADVRNGRDAEHEVVVRTRAGRLAAARAHCTRLIDESGAPSGALLVLTCHEDQAAPRGTRRRAVGAPAATARRDADELEDVAGCLARIPPDGGGAETLIDMVLRAARSRLDMDVAWFGQAIGSRVAVRRVACERRGLDIWPVEVPPSSPTLCELMLRGVIPSVVEDVREDWRTRRTTVARTTGIGAYVGVPVFRHDGTLHGTLCCGDHEACRPVGEIDLRFVYALAELLGRHLDRADAARHAQQTQVEQAIDVLLTALAARDRYTAAHSDDVLALAVRCGEELELGDLQLAEVAHVALLHDIGKIGVPDALLGKPGPLDADEWTTMREHPVTSARLVGSVPCLLHLEGPIRAEHERWDGGGYPDGLRGEAIPLSSRIVFVCDAFHAMTSDRPYRAAMPVAAARAELATGAGTQFDPDVVTALLRVLDEFRTPTTGRTASSGVPHASNGRP
jgi:GAF domain-containing protein